MRRPLVVLAALHVCLVVLAYAAGWVGASGLSVREGLAYQLHRWVGLVAAFVTVLLPTLGWFQAGRVTDSEGGEKRRGNDLDRERDRLRARIFSLGVGAGGLAIVTVLLGLLSERADWSGYWHLGAASGLLSYGLGAWALMLGSYVAAVSRRRAGRSRSLDAASPPTAP